MMQRYAIRNNPSAPGKFLAVWMVILPIFMLGRVQESFPFLWPFRLVLWAALITVWLLLRNQGFSKPRFSLLWRSTTFKWFLAMLGAMVFSLPDSIWLSKSVGFLREFVLFNGLFLLALNCQVNKREDLNYVLAGAVVTTGLLAMICLVMPQYVAGRVFANYTYDPNDQALMFVIMLALLLPGLKHMKKLHRWGVLGVAAMSLGAIVLTQSRGALVALVVMACFWGAARGFKGMIRMAGVGIMVLVLILTVFPSEKLSRFNTILDLENDYNVTGKHGRLDVWKNGMNVFRKSPINGAGLSTFFIAVGDSQTGRAWTEAHNSFVEIAVELGVPGIVLFLGLLWSVFRRARSAGGDDWLGMGIRLATVAYVSGGVFLSWGYQFVFYFVVHISIVRERVLATERAALAASLNAPANSTTETDVDGTPKDIGRNSSGRRRYQLRKAK